MDKDALNMQIRKFLKKVGVTSQRTIEEAVNKALENNTTSPGDSFQVSMTLTIPELDVSMQIEDTIDIE